MHHRKLSSLNTFLRACSWQGQGQVTISRFAQMQQEGLLPDKVTLFCVLSACSSQAALPEGKQMHARIMGSEFISDVALVTALVNMYGKCGRPNDASKIFHEMHDRDVVAWNSMIMIYAEHGLDKEAFQVFYQMLQKGVMPNKVTFVNILTSCTSHAAIGRGEQIHDHILKSGLEGDVVIGNALINMYGKCGTVEDAQSMFDKIAHRDLVSWNAMFSVYALHGQGKEALLLFGKMDKEGILPNKITFVSILAVFASQSMVAESERMHVRVLNSGCELDTYVGNALVNMYGKCGRLENAVKSFDRIPRRDVVSFTAMIAVYHHNGHCKKAIELFDKMQQNGVAPNKVTFVNMLAACASSGSLAEGKRMHGLILEYGFESDVFIGNALIHMYGKCASLIDAKRLFDKMLERDVVSWNAFIAAYSQNEEGIDALHIFQQMQHEGNMPDEITFASILDAFASYGALVEGERVHAYLLDRGLELDVAVGNALVKMYGKCGNLDDAWKTFIKIPGQNIVSWNEMIAMLTYHGKGMKALELFEQMKWEGIVPNETTFVSILSACANQAMLVEGKWIHSCIQNHGFESDVILGTALVTMYGKCGSIEDALKMFCTIPEPSTVGWNAMIAVHAQHGQGKEAILLFDQMQQARVMPDKATFVSVLAACSHAGLIDECWHYFVSMNQKHYISPDVEHYVCIIDLLGRAGRLDEAENFINNMPVQPTLASFMALLAACRYLSDVERGNQVAKQLFEFHSKNAAPYVIISSMQGVANGKLLKQELAGFNGHS